MGCIIMKCCCCVLKWGTLTVAIIDMIMAAAVILETKYLTYYEDWEDQSIHDEPNNNIENNYYGPTYYVWMLTFVIHSAHLVACVLVIVSVWVQIKKLVFAYLIIGIIRIIYDLIFLIYICIEVGAVIFTLLLILAGFGVAIYFWFVVYSWSKMLKGSSQVD